MPEAEPTSQPAPPPAALKSNYSRLLKDGLWQNNPALVQLLGLCPLLAVTTSFVNGLVLGISTIFVMVCSGLCVSLGTPFIPQSVRLPVYVLIISSLVTCVELAIQAFLFPIYINLGIFLPLIVTNCAILGRAEAFAAKNKPLPAMLDAFAHGAGFALVLILLGSIREIIGTGKIFSDFYALGIDDFAALDLPFLDGFLLLLLPPGGFIVMGLFILLNNIIRERAALRQRVKAKKPEAGAKRIRVSG